jgi:hypothetical protein
MQSGISCRQCLLHPDGVLVFLLAASRASVTIKAFQSDGVTEIGIPQDRPPLNALGHTAAFANELISGLPAGFMGVLDISSETPFAALTLRSLYNKRDDCMMTTFPVADANKTAPSPIVFPQVVDGGSVRHTVYSHQPHGWSEHDAAF